MPPIGLSSTIRSKNSRKAEAMPSFGTLEVRAMAPARRLISGGDSSLTTCAAASWPIDIMTTADFSMSVRSAGRSEAISVTCHPLPDHLGRPGRIVRRQHPHGLGIDDGFVLRSEGLDRRSPGHADEQYGLHR